MFELIERLRRKSDRTKKQVAFLTALFVAGVIFVVWLSVIYPDFRKKQQKINYVSNLEPSPLGTLGDTFRTGLSAIGEQFTSLKEAVSSITTSPSYYSTTSVTTNEVVLSTTTTESTVEFWELDFEQNMEVRE